ncbi:bile acid:sodium symporter family protein [Sphingomonas immobilis]|uniref:Bile acid:sodium symporter family protein n=1 Tax=Sphingomonas immobilis TaxID=3063997 RepID=A0ABT8ZU22_9SPHN|nr:bile acid:sodium symporter family protein [Sphingomonas sp. CA1-15]MDO7840707.1 bile acid:sodium symporter family protein [Sphingomonas sp. CA1-15]
MAKFPKPSFSIDPFLLCLIAVVAAASLLPVRGVAAGWVDLAADLAVALLFFLHGAKLSRAAIVQGMGNWRLHALVLGSTYVLFPAIGLALIALLQGWSNPWLLSGLLFLCLLPSTVQSSIAFTAIARGNVAAAVCSASLSNLLGIFVTPLLVALLMKADGGVGGGSAGSSWHSIWTITVQLLLPFLAGHFLRPLIGGFVDRNKKILQPVDRGSILLVVYSAFSAAVVGGIWTQVGIGDLLGLVALSGVILALVMGANLIVARMASLSREDFIVLLFCGSKKSLASGVPMAGALFAPAHVGLIVLPLMIFHQLQLFVCAVLAGRFQRAAIAAEAAVGLPRSEAEIGAAAAAVGMTIPEACMPGVVANMALLDKHAGNLRG